MLFNLNVVDFASNTENNLHQLSIDRICEIVMEAQEDLDVQTSFRSSQNIMKICEFQSELYCTYEFLFLFSSYYSSKHLINCMVTQLLSLLDKKSKWAFEVFSPTSNSSTHMFAIGFQ